MSDTVLITQDNRGVATLTLNRPDVYNAFDDTTVAILNRELERLGQDPEVRIVVLAAAGKAFSAGGDLNWMKRMVNYDHDENMRDASQLANLMYRLNFLAKPTIARVQGAAFGGAVGLVSCCDFALGSEHASFSLSEVKIGLAPATIAPYVVAAIGQRAARRYSLSGERFDAATALRMGLLHQVVAAAELDAALENLIDSLLANSPQGMRVAKQLIFEVSDQPIDQALTHKTVQAIAELRASGEGQEGLAAFLEKRPPNWNKHKK
ncbi:MAG: enoyl-CoA hydratase/isomerase family protein [Gammaproteobacteria bacterium]|nr:enoyl-CoA hydratase/isomerase family protein [Gammaproteobacteria bacterium]